MQIDGARGIAARLEAQDASLDDQAEIAEAILVLCHSWTSTLTGVGMRGEMGAPDWSASELKIWQLGESLRLFLKRRRWRGQGPLLDGVARVAISREFGKGRQTLVLLLGEYGNKDYGAVLGGLLDDPEVCGHAVKALRMAKIPMLSQCSRYSLANRAGSGRRRSGT